MTKEETVEEVKATKTKATTKATKEVEVEEKNEVAVKTPEPDFAGLDLAELGFTEEDLKSLTGLENIDSSEISIPYATLISKATREYEVGDIVFPDGSVIKGGKDEREENVSILNLQPVRVYFPQPFSPKNSFVCRSLDGKVGAPDGEYAGRACNTCEFAQYPEDGGSSPCRDQRLLLCTRADGSLFHLQVAGVGMGVWKKFMSAQVFHLLPKVRQIFGAINVSIGVKMVDTDYGAFPSLDFNTDSANPFHDVDRLKESLVSLKSYKEFAQEHASSAADQTKIQMAVGEIEPESTGANSTLF